MTTLNNPTATITVNVLNPGQGWDTLLYDADSGGLLARCNSGVSLCVFTVGPGTDQKQNYKVLVDVSTATFSVTNTGWHGTVTLNAKPAVTTATNPLATLTVKTNQPVRLPYVISIASPDGNTVATCPTEGSTTGCSTTVAPPNKKTWAYTAYVAYTISYPGSPPVNVRATSARIVQNIGWHGDVYLTWAPSTNPADTAPVFTATASPYFPSPYMLSIYDNGNLIASCPESPCVTSIDISHGDHNITAYVSEDTPRNTTPTNDVPGWATIPTSGGVPGVGTHDGVSNDQLVAQMTAAGPAAVLDALDVVPGSHVQKSSVSDQRLDAEPALAANKTMQEVLVLIVASLVAAGFIVGDFLYQFDQALFTGPVTPPAPTPPGQPVPNPVPVTPVDPGPGESYEDELTVELQEKATVKLTLPEARVAAKECIAGAEKAIAAGILAPSDEPCSGRTIYFPGSSYPRTTQHDFDAIFGRDVAADTQHPDNDVTGQIQWIQLNYVSGPDRKSQVRKSWYARTYPCNSAFTGLGSGNDCDEYPFYASSQSGPGASLQAIITQDNQQAGTRYGTFISTCKLISGGRTATRTLPLGSPFLVIPIPGDWAPPTFEICGS